jgi:tRNA(Ser,Leu) C12 N-acetylase TAN1
MAKDMELSAEVQLTNPNTIAGVQMLEQLGLIGVGRAAQVLANRVPV